MIFAMIDSQLSLLDTLRAKCPRMIKPIKSHAFGSNYIHVVYGKLSAQ